MNSSCTIIPTHPPKFNFAIKAVESFNFYDIGDLYIIFSNESDEILFRNSCNQKYNFLILPESKRDYKSYVTVKKFFAVNELMQKYEYIGVFDSEVEFIKKYNPNKLYKSIFNKKEFKSNLSKNGHKMLSSCLDLIEFGDLHEFILEQTDNLNQYWWFNEICVYERQTFFEFYQWLQNQKKYDSILNNWYCFDYHLYSLWLIAFKNFKIKKLCQQTFFEWGAIEFNTNGNVSNKFKSHADRVKTKWSKVLIHTDRI